MFRNIFYVNNLLFHSYNHFIGCKYGVLRKVIKSFHWVETDDDKDWNLFWTDTGVSAERLKRMSSYQV